MLPSDAALTSLPDSPPRHGRPHNSCSLSRWQQLKQSIAAQEGPCAGSIEDRNGSIGNTAAWQLIVQKFAVDQGTTASCRPDAALSIQEEAADLIRRTNISSYYQYKTADLSIQPDGKIGGINWYQDKAGHSAANHGPVFSSTDIPWADTNIDMHKTYVQHDIQSAKSRLSLRQTSLQQLKQLRHQAQPWKKTQGGLGHNSCVQQPTEATTPSPKLTTASFGGSHQSTHQPLFAAQTGSPSSSCACSWASTGSVSGMALPVAAGPPAAVGAASSAGSKGQTNSASSSRDFDSMLMNDLRQELAFQVQHKLLRRWQQATADVLLEKTRARPMNKLLSKRKVLRAWRLAVQQQAGDGPRSMSLQGPDSAAHPAAVQQAVDQEGPAVTADVLQQQSPRLQHQQQEHFAQSEAVAVKFHKLYHLHSCWCTWQQQATASALQRLREQQDKILAEEQTRVQQQQQNQLQQQRQRQKLHRLKVATEFHRLYILHQAIASWHQQAAVSAALSKLFPDTGLAAAARGCRDARHSLCFPVGMANDKVHTAAVIQYKAQQLLQRLAGKQAIHQQEQQAQQTEARADQLMRHQPSCGSRPSSPPARGQQQQPRRCIRQGKEPSLCRSSSSLSSLSSAAVTAATTAALAVSGPAEGIHMPAAAITCFGSQPAADCADISAARQVETAPAVYHSTVQDATCSSTAGMAASSCATLPAEQHDASVTPAPGSQMSTGLHEVTMGDAVADLLSQCTVNIPAEEGMTCQQQQQQVALFTNSACAMGQSDKAAQINDEQQQQHLTTDPAHSTAGQAIAQPVQISGPEQLMQVQQQPPDRQQLQQQYRRLLAVEQRQQRQQQRLEQQLQAEIAAEQCVLAGLHYNLVLVVRMGLAPWRSMMKLKQQQQATASTWRETGLLKAALLVWKLMLVHRRKRCVCCQLRAFGQLRHVQQQWHKAKGLRAFAAWAQANTHHKQWLLRQTLAAWRENLQTAQQSQSAAQQMFTDRKQRQVVQAWVQYVEQQAQEQLMLEVNLSTAAQQWRLKWWQQRVLKAWQMLTVSAIQDSRREAKRQETWGRVRGWLSEAEASMTCSSTVNGQTSSHVSEWEARGAAYLHVQSLDGEP